MKFHREPTSRTQTVRRRRICRCGRSSAAGFTLAEVLAALVFMAIVIPVALEGLSIASRAGEVAARKSDAALVADRVLNESLVTTNWNQAVQTGTLRQGIRDFRWTLHNDPWTVDPGANAIRLLTVDVAFTAQGKDYSVHLSTLANAPFLFAQTNSAP
jgi:type II secretory pathway pseudopilin PulG